MMKGKLFRTKIITQHIISTLARITHANKLKQYWQAEYVLLLDSCCSPLKILIPTKIMKIIEFIFTFIKDVV